MFGPATVRWCALAASLLAGCGRLSFERVAPDQDAPPGGDAGELRANRAFLSSVRVSGALGGPAGADAICAGLAADAHLDGEYVALLRGGSRPTAISVLAGSRGWKTIDGRWVADAPAQLGVGEFLNTIDRHEDGVLNPSGSEDLRVWSGDDGEDCADWHDASASSTGDQHYLPQWSRLSDGGLSCDQAFRLFCLERGHVFPRIAPALDHRLLFVSRATWAPSAMGRAGADAVCQAEAVAAMRSGTFVALLPLATEPATARISAAATELYQRIDGELVGTLVAPSSYFMLGADGAPAVGPVWTGGLPDRLPAATCSSWTSMVGTAEYGEAFLNDDGRYSIPQLVPCSDPHRLYCVQVPSSALTAHPL